MAKDDLETLMKGPHPEFDNLDTYKSRRKNKRKPRVGLKVLGKGWEVARFTHVKATKRWVKNRYGKFVLAEYLEGQSDG